MKSRKRKKFDVSEKVVSNEQGMSMEMENFQETKTKNTPNSPKRKVRKMKKNSCGKATVKSNWEFEQDFSQSEQPGSSSAD